MVAAGVLYTIFVSVALLWLTRGGVGRYSFLILAALVVPAACGSLNRGM